jgi:hypothetical protein
LAHCEKRGGKFWVFVSNRDEPRNSVARCADAFPASIIFRLEQMQGVPEPRQQFGISRFEVLVRGSAPWSFVNHFSRPLKRRTARYYRDRQP